MPTKTTLIVYQNEDGDILVLAGDAPCSDFEDLGLGDHIREISMPASGPGLWAWADEGSYYDEDDGSEAWLGAWRRLTPDELHDLASPGEAG